MLHNLPIELFEIILSFLKSNYLSKLRTDTYLFNQINNYLSKYVEDIINSDQIYKYEHERLLWDWEFDYYSKKILNQNGKYLRFLRKIESPMYNQIVNMKHPTNIIRTNKNLQEYNHPKSVSFSNNGEFIAIVDSFNYQINIYDNNFNSIRSIGQDILRYPIKCIFSKNKHNLIIVSDSFFGNIYIFNIFGSLILTINLDLINLKGIDINSDNNLIVGVDTYYKNLYCINFDFDYNYNKLKKDINNNCRELFKYLIQPSDIKFSNDDKLIFISDCILNQVFIFNLDGILINSIGIKKNFNCDYTFMDNPISICVDNIDNILVQDSNKIYLFDSKYNFIKIIKEIKRGKCSESFGGIDICPKTFRLICCEESKNIINVY